MTPFSEALQEKVFECLLSYKINLYFMILFNYFFFFLTASGNYMIPIKKQKAHSRTLLEWNFTVEQKYTRQIC